MANTYYTNCIAYNYNTDNAYNFKADEDTKIVNSLNNTDPKFVKINTNEGAYSLGSDKGRFNPLEDNINLQSDAPKKNVGVYWMEQ